MANVRLKYLAPICDITGRYQETVTVEDGSTIMDVIEMLCQRYGRPVHDLFYDDAGTFQPRFIIMRNAQPMDDEDLTRPLCDGDTCTFVPPIAGG